MNLKRINNLLLVVIVAINVYVIFMPFVPKISYWWDTRNKTQEQHLTTQIHKPSPSKNQPAPSVVNMLTVPSMLLDQPILEGSIRDQYTVLDKGIWRWPRGSTPDKGGNTVLIGHRFTYTNPRGVFYQLDKVKMGDEIGVVWNKQNYLYKVSEIKIEAPTDLSIEAPTKDAQLTLFTCTPVWKPTNRLVVIAKLEGRP
jgi:sortase A